MEFLVVGDTHLGVTDVLFPGGENNHAWTFAPMLQVEAYARKHKIKTIVQLGDLFDQAEPSQQLIADTLDFLHDSRATWHVNSGNHDMAGRSKHAFTVLSRLSQKRYLPHRFYTKPATVNINKIPFTFLPYPRTKLFDKTMPQIVIAHVSRHGFQYESGHFVEGHEFNLHNHHWLIGHLHNYQADKRVIYPGSLTQTRYNESPDKYFLHGKVAFSDGKLRLKCRQIKLNNAYNLFEITLTDKLKLKLPDNSFVKLVIPNGIKLSPALALDPRIVDKRYLNVQTKRTDYTADEAVKLTSKADHKAQLKKWLEQCSNLERAEIKAALRLSKQLMKQHGEGNARRDQHE